MVEIIGQDNSIPKEISCLNCAAKLRYVPKDIQVGNETGSGGPYSHQFITCPSCNHKVIVNSW